MSVYDPNVVVIPTLSIGTPFTLSSGGAGSETASLIGKVAIADTAINGLKTIAVGAGNPRNATSTNVAVHESSTFRPIFNFTNATTGASVKINTNSALFVDLKTTMNTLLKTIHNTNVTKNTEGFKGFNFINYDLRSFSSLNNANGSSISKVAVYVVYNNAGTSLTNSTGLPINMANMKLVSITNSTQLQDFINLNSTDTTKVANPSFINENLFGQIKNTATIGLVFVFTTAGNNPVGLSSNGEPIITDFFSVGLIGDGSQSAQRIDNGVYRWEPLESGDNTAVFTGSSQYLMLNQLNIFDPNTYSTLRTINHDAKFVVIQDMMQSEGRALHISAVDTLFDGNPSQKAVQQDIPTHTGVVSFDSKTYKIADTVTITLNDPDLNVDNDLVDVYTVVAPPAVPIANAGGAVVAGSIFDPAAETVGATGFGFYADNKTPFG
ncbi:MAG: hypothetical protein ACREA8_03925, partial [Nitrosotalea sp.]